MQILKDGLELIFRIADNKTTFIYSSDFEECKHGIMSAYLLIRNVEAFKAINFEINKPIHKQELPNNFFIKQDILNSISDHTNDVFGMTNINRGSF